MNKNTSQQILELALQGTTNASIANQLLVTNLALFLVEKGLIDKDEYIAHTKEVRKASINRLNQMDMSEDEKNSHITMTEMLFDIHLMHMGDN